SKLSTQQRTDIHHATACGDTGQVNGSPAASFQKMSLINADKSPEGWGGRATIPGNRNEIPSIQPRLLKSATRTSPISLCAPYESVGLGSVASSTTGGNGAPYTATLLANTTSGGWRSSRSCSR